MLELLTQHIRRVRLERCKEHHSKDVADENSEKSLYILRRSEAEILLQRISHLHGKTYRYSRFLTTAQRFPATAPTAPSSILRMQ
tara:strand:- start:655 stop:909 length:255 start_codon:yes stop_codon:yes gene_type:complete